MSFTTLKTVSFLVLVFVGHWSSVYGATISTTLSPSVLSSWTPTTTAVLESASPTTQVVNPTNQTTLLTSFNLSEPMLPALTNYLIFRPLVDFNNQLSQAADGLPKLLGQNAEQLGSAIAWPIQSSVSTANQMVSRVNDTITSASKYVQPAIARPAVWLGQVNTALTNMTLNAVNSTTNRVGQKISNVGASFTNAAQDVQQLGESMAEWLKQLETDLQQQINQLNATLNAPVTEVASSTENVSIESTTMKTVENSTEGTTQHSIVNEETNLMDH